MGVGSYTTVVYDTCHFVAPLLERNRVGKGPNKGVRSYTTLYDMCHFVALLLTANRVGKGPNKGVRSYTTEAFLASRFWGWNRTLLLCTIGVFLWFHFLREIEYGKDPTKGYDRTLLNKK